MEESDKRLEVQRFLNRLKAKMTIRIPAVLYLDKRPKNSQTLVELQMIPRSRDEIIASLEIGDYCEGPVEEKLFQGNPMWVFGKVENGVELYIKITLGHTGASALCISFHRAEHPMKYCFA